MISRNLKFILFLLLLLMVAFPAYAQRPEFPPKPAGFVSDFYHQVGDDIEDKIEDIADELRRVTSINLMVIVVRSTLPLDADAYAKKVYDDWDVGRKEKGLDHGVLLLVSIIDREVRVLPGSGVDFILTPRIRENIQWAVFPSLGRGRISEGVYIGAMSISRMIMGEWPKYEGLRRARLDMQRLSLVAFILFLTAVFTTLIFNLNYLAGFGMVVGGLFGYLLLDVFGTVIGALLGFLLNFWVSGREETAAEKEVRKVYEEFKRKKKSQEERK